MANTRVRRTRVRSTNAYRTARRRSSPRLRSPLRRQSMLRRPRLPAAGVAPLWLFLSTLCGLMAALAESLTVIIVWTLICITTLLIGMMGPTALEKLGASTPGAASPKTRDSGGKRPRGPRTETRRASDEPRDGTAKPPKPRKRPACPSACRRSVKPRDTCDCVCGGSNHGTGSSGGPGRKPSRAPARRTNSRSNVGDTYGPWKREI